MTKLQTDWRSLDTDDIAVHTQTKSQLDYVRASIPNMITTALWEKVTQILATTMEMDLWI